MKASDNPFPSLLLVEQAAAPATPPPGQARLYRGTDNKLYIVDDAGVATEVGAGGGGGSGGSLAACRVKRVAAYTPTLSAVAAIPWDGEDYDTDGFHDPSTNPARLTIPTGLGGTYVIGGGWVPSTQPNNGERCIGLIRVNGTTEIAQQEVVAVSTNSFPSPFVSTEYQLAAGDYVEMMYYHGATSGAPGFVAGKTHMYIRKVG